MQQHTRLIGLFLLLALALNTTFAGVVPTDPEPTPNCQLPAPSVTLDYVTPTSAQISWTPISGAYAYKAQLSDVTQSSMNSQDVTVTTITYGNTLIIPGHKYEFKVTPYCGPDDPGTESMVLKFTAPIIVIIDIVERECQSGSPTSDLVHFLPSGGLEPGAPVSFDLNYENNILVCDPEVTRVMLARQVDYLRQSREVTLDEVQAWPIHRRIWNNALAILGPVL